MKLSDLTQKSSGSLNNFILFRLRIMLYEVEDNGMYTSKAKDESDEMEYSMMWAPSISIHRAHVEHTGSSCYADSAAGSLDNGGCTHELC